MLDGNNNNSRFKRFYSISSHEISEMVNRFMRMHRIAGKSSPFSKSIRWRTCAMTIVREGRNMNDYTKRQTGHYWIPFLAEAFS